MYRIDMPATVLHRPLLAPTNRPQDVKGQGHAAIQRGHRKIEEEMFIVKDLNTLFSNSVSMQFADCRWSTSFSTDDIDFCLTLPVVFTELHLLWMTKYNFAMTAIPFLGHIINYNGTRADPAKIKAILAMPDLKDVEDVFCFMCITNFIGKFSSRLLE